MAPLPDRAETFFERSKRRRKVKSIFQNHGGDAVEVPRLRVQGGDGSGWFAEGGHVPGSQGSGGGKSGDQVSGKHEIGGLPVADHVYDALDIGGGKVTKEGYITTVDDGKRKYQVTAKAKEGKLRSHEDVYDALDADRITFHVKDIGVSDDPDE